MPINKTPNCPFKPQLLLQIYIHMYISLLPFLLIPVLSFSFSLSKKKMQSMINLHGSCGLPLSVSGFTHHFSLSKEIVDHDRRREAMRKQRSRGGDRQMGFRTLITGVQKGQIIDEDLVHVLQDLQSCAAKAA